MTGGIGSGKSAATDYLTTLGVQILDADRFAHQVTASGQPAVAEIAQQLGQQVLTASGDLDRAMVRQIVFTDKSKLEALEAIVHPKVRSAMNAAASNAKSPYVVYAIPLLVETQQTGKFDHVVVIQANHELRRQRVLTRSGLDKESFDRIMASQASDQERAAVANTLIVNESSLDQLHQEIDNLHLNLCALAAEK